jgi:hypothetical protein
MEKHLTRYIDDLRRKKAMKTLQNLHKIAKSIATHAPSIAERVETFCKTISDTIVEVRQGVQEVGVIVSKQPTPIVPSDLLPLVDATAKCINAAAERIKPSVSAHPVDEVAEVKKQIETTEKQWAEEIDLLECAKKKSAVKGIQEQIEDLQEIARTEKKGLEEQKRYLSPDNVNKIKESLSRRTMQRKIAVATRLKGLSAAVKAGIFKPEPPTADLKEIADTLDKMGSDSLKEVTSA